MTTKQRLKTALRKNDLKGLRAEGDVLSAHEAAKLAGLSSWRLRQLSMAGRVPHATIRGRYFFFRDEVLSWMFGRT
jgi:hypothetical protein